MILHWIAAHWLSLPIVGVATLAVLFPAVSLPVARWLLLTERGRTLLLVAVAAWGFLFLRNHYLHVGYSNAMAEQARAADRARVDAAFAALDGYMAGAARMADIGQQQEQHHAQALAARDRTIAGLRAGTLQLRDHWQCLPADATATASGERDESTERRQTGAGDLVQVADESDADLAACQATLTEYQRIGVLRQ